MDRTRTPWERCVEFHGHECPGLAVGYRVAQIALKELGVERAQDEELVAIVENDACGVDAIQVLTGCTLGKGNLLYRDYGKQVYTIGNRKNREAIRIVVKSVGWRQELEKLGLNREGRIRFILELQKDDFCTVQKIPLEFPERARIYKSWTCAECGESVMEARLRVKDGEFVCIPCAGEYNRGW